MIVYFYSRKGMTIYRHATFISRDHFCQVDSEYRHPERASEPDVRRAIRANKWKATSDPLIQEFEIEDSFFSRRS